MELFPASLITPEMELLGEEKGREEKRSFTWVSCMNKASLRAAGWLPGNRDRGELKMSLSLILRSWLMM